MANNCLIGHTGFVGKNLTLQTQFDKLYNTANISQVGGLYDTVVCSAAPAVKWLANKEPQEDLSNIEALMLNLETVQCKRFILISTIDVYSSTEGNDEASTAYEGLQGYGRNRRLLEEFVEHTFSNHLVVRLPALFGKGLKKNVLFDLLNNNRIDQISLQDTYQWYDVGDLWTDILNIPQSLQAINLFPEPIRTSDILKKFFPQYLELVANIKKVTYNNRSKYFKNGYVRSADEVLHKINQFIDAYEL